jgi:NAD(P)H-dependent FMN reductase
MMTIQPTILVFAGSAREGSYNKKLARVVSEALQAAGAKVTLVDLRDFPMPLFDQDLEAAGDPAPVTALKTLMKQADGFVISSPEHNSTYSALLKNTIDWASRKREGETALQCFAGKAALLVSASPGQLGGLRGLLALRALLGNLRVLVSPDQLAVSSAHTAFREDGSLADQKQAETVANMAASFVALAGKLKN